MDKKEFIKKNGLYIFAFGFFVFMFLVFEDPQESILLVLSAFMLFKLIKDTLEQPFLMILGTLIIFLLLSYIASNLFLLTQSYNMDLENISPVKKLEGTAVLLVYEGEAEKYDLKKSLANIKYNCESNEKLLTPFLLYKDKSNYKNIGRSNFKKNTIDVRDELQQVLDENYKVYVSYLRDSRYVEECLIDIVNDGYYNVIVVPMLLTNGHTMEVLKTRVEMMKLFNLNINLKYIDPLWNNNAITLAYIKLIEEYVNKNELEDIGILLIGEGEKGYNRGNHIESAKGNLMIRNKIKSYLISDLGISEHRIKTAWFNYIEPNYTDTVRDLLEYGVGNIIIVYVKPSVTNIENNTIIREIKSEVELPEGVKVRALDGFLKDTNTINELKSIVEYANMQSWE